MRSAAEHSTKINRRREIKRDLMRDKIDTISFAVGTFHPGSSKAGVWLSVRAGVRRR